jgi:ubiquinone/menaquinone biosynthesis C-methylase UbiE
LEYLQPQYGQGIVDVSCGSGLFTRRFLKSGKFPSVIALDFSENMLKQTKAFIEEDSSLDARSVKIIRADVNRLPFKTGSVAAMHAGVSTTAATS